MNKQPNREWAYDIVKRWEGGKRTGLTITAYKIAKGAMRVAEDEAAEKLKVDKEAGEVRA